MMIKKYLLASATIFFRNNYYHYAYGLGRSILAFSLLLTFAFNNSAILFRAIDSHTVVPYCNPNSFNLFCILKNHLELARLISCGLLIIVISGWRPRFTGILHWWISHSLIMSTPMIEGGEQVGAVLTLFLIPVTILDNRNWHWQEYSLKKENSTQDIIKKFIALIFFRIAQLQVAIIYLHSAVGKCSVPEWIDGTAMYYWMIDPLFGMNRHWLNLFLPILSNSILIAVISWGVIIWEFLLFTGFFLNKREKFILLICGILFHILIALFHGLISFSLMMIGALVIYLLQCNLPIFYRKRNFDEPELQAQANNPKVVVSKTLLTPREG